MKIGSFRYGPEEIPYILIRTLDFCPSLLWMVWSESYMRNEVRCFSTGCVEELADQETKQTKPNGFRYVGLSMPPRGRGRNLEGYGSSNCLLYPCARPDCFSLLPRIVYYTNPLALLFLATSKILQSITWAIHMTFYPFFGRQSCLQSKTSWQKEIGARTWDGIMQQSAFCTPA